MSLRKLTLPTCEALSGGRDLFSRSREGPEGVFSRHDSVRRRSRDGEGAQVQPELADVGGALADPDPTFSTCP